MFRDKIPEEVLETKTVSDFIDVLDGVQAYKTENINKALRVYNLALSLDKKWLIKYLEEFGVTGFPETLPMEILIQFSANISAIMGLRGSKLGIQMLCSVLTLGEVTVDDSAYYADPKLLILDAPNSALMVDDTLDARLFLASDTDDLNDFKTVDITINTYLWATGASETVKTAVQAFLLKMLQKYVPYSNNPTINITYASRETRYYHPQLNSFLV